MTPRELDGSVTIASDRVRAVVLPESGARVVSLSRVGGREWLADSGRGVPRTRPEAWAKGDVRGWDECFPNIAAGAHPLTGRPLLDHGEVWNVPWRADVAAAEFDADVTLRHHDIALRRVLTCADVLDADYTATAYEPVDVAWAMHLLLDADASTLALPDDTPVRADSVWGSLTSLPSEWTTWRDMRAQLPLDVASGWACKLFTAPGSVRDVTVDAGDERLTVAIADAPAPPVFGLWINRAGIADLDVHHLGVEAGFGDHDALGAAIASGSALTLSPDEPARWHVRISMTARAEGSTS